jgi:DMSO reductase anchor subunit
MPRVLSLHRWIGTATALWAVGTALLLKRDERLGVRSRWFLIWLIIGAALVGSSGHLGGVLVHGADYLTGE